MISMHIKVLEALPQIPPWLQICSPQHWLYVSIWLNQRQLLSPCKWNLWSFFPCGSSYILNSVHGVTFLPNPKLPTPGSFSTLFFLCTFDIHQIQMGWILFQKCLFNLPRLSYYLYFFGSGRKSSQEKVIPMSLIFPLHSITTTISNSSNFPLKSISTLS